MHLNDFNQGNKLFTLSHDANSVTVNLLLGKIVLPKLI